MMDGPEAAASGPGVAAADLGRQLRDALQEARSQAHLDPFSNPILLQALALTRRMDAGEVRFEDVAALIREITADAFLARAARLRAMLGSAGPDDDAGRIAALVHTLAGETVTLPFDNFRQRVERAGIGLVLTGHPTFSIDLPPARLLARLAAEAPADPAAARAEAMALSHRPPAALTLDAEHDWSVEALTHAHAALERTHAVVLDVARGRYPARWTELVPRLVTFASWVGYDQDGRVDVTWDVTLSKRLLIKQALIARHAARLAELADGADMTVGRRIGRLAEEFTAAAAAVGRQIAALEAGRADPAALPAFEATLLDGAAPVETGPWQAALAEIVAAAPTPALQRDLAVVRASLATHGLGLAHIHVRLNSTQLHNAIRKEVRLDTSPDDPARRRSYFNAINELLGTVEPATINLGSLLAERTSAKRLFMVIAQIVRHVDAETPVRFLIAETESGFTLLTALYFARLFGVEDRVELSPLFETEEALARGEAVLEEALRSPHFRDHVRARKRLAVQFGFSDSGRFLGQMSATFRIERLRLRIAQLLEKHGMADVEVILFNTHGESVGRGAHPGTLGDRLRYVAPPVNRAEFARRGIAVKEEVSFQGGDGYLPFLAPETAFATVRGVIEFALGRDPEAEGDPIYEEADFAAEFFATIQQRFTGLVDDPDYAALLSLYGTNLLWKTGSRPVIRAREDRLGAPEITHPSQMRAIPNNAVLQQLGMMSNVLHGVGRAIAHDPARSAEMPARSPRFRRAMALVEHARAASDFDVLRAYLSHYDPGMWLTRSGRARHEARSKELALLSETVEGMGLHDRLARLTRRLQADYLDLTKAVRPHAAVDRETIILLHILRLALMQRTYLLATHIPEFSPQQGTTRELLVERILHLDVEVVVERLRRIFPLEDGATAARPAFAAPATYRPDAGSGYEAEHRTIFGPMLAHYEQCRAVTSALTYLIGAVG